MRELDNAIERAVVLAKGKTLKKDDFAFLFRTAGQEAQEIPQSLKDMEKKHIEQILTWCRWNISKAATIHLEKRA